MRRVVVMAWGIVVLAAGVALAQTERARPTTPPVGRDTWQASGTHGAVVAGGMEAVDAGMATLQAGGNATDAAVATILALSVTDANQFCFGGEVPILIHDAPTRTIEVIAGQGAAPRLATREHFEAIGGIPRTGIEPAAVPAALDACLTALDRRGTLTFARVAAPTLAILDRREHPWHADLARTLRLLIDAERQSPGDRRRGLRLVADAFYRGPIAHRIDAWSREHGGLLRYVDLATHATRVEEPVTRVYRGHTIVKCGPWTQGPMLLQTLQLLEGFDLKAWGHNRPDTIHATAEALKLALADRDAFYADPLFMDVPLRELFAPAYVVKRRGLIDLAHASRVHRPGDPRTGEAVHADPDSLLPTGEPAPARDTTTCLVADGRGSVVAATPSGWSGVLAGDTGVWLGTRLQSFNLQPGHPNVIEPGKRPRITLTPTLVLDPENRPVIAVSVAGGDGQDQVTLQLLLNRIDFGLSPAEAVIAPRFVTEQFVSSFGQAAPKLGSLKIDAEVGADVIRALSDRGHGVEIGKPPLWHPTMIAIDPATGRLDAAGDPRAGRHASAY
jgi:gamma-glutamyltranspeptidase/glutathione hydrolase